MPAIESPASRRASLLLAALLSGATLSVAAAQPPAPRAASPAAVAFVDVTVIPMDGERVLPGQTVVVRDGRIAQLGPAGSVRVPAGAEVVAGRGRYLIPGLAEMHAHLPPPQAGDTVMERTLFLFLAGGVTTVRGMLGHPQHLAVRERVARGELLGPRIYTSGPSLNGSSTPTPEAAARAVAEQKAAGYDFLKLHPGLARATFDTVDALADRLGLRYAGHVSAAVGLNRALQAGYASIDHLDGYVEAAAGHGDGFAPEVAGFFGFALTDRVDDARLTALAAATRAAGVWNVPTQTLLEQLASPEPPEVLARRPEMRYVPPQTLAQWTQRKRTFQQAPGFSPERARRYVEVRRRLIKALHDAGAPLALGSDAPQWWNVPGFSARRELELLVAAGLTPYQALATGTRAPAEFFGAQEEWGTLAVGRAADLVLLEANPLDDITNLWKQAGVMVHGRWLPQPEIERRLGG